MPVAKVWKSKECDINDDLLQFCDNNRILATLLVNRGIFTPEKARKFLNPGDCKLSSPDVFFDMQKAADRIISAIENKEHITVYGDFDADGVTSTALLYKTLKFAGADVDYYLPDRDSESHGLNTKAVINLISKRKTKLIITVDCGISDVSEVNFANGFKVDVIITDHHEAPEVLPCAYAIINPKAHGALDESLSAEDTENLNLLAGAGVALKLAYKILELINEESFLKEILPLAAIGTIGDIVDLKGENRIVVTWGLKLIREGNCPKGVQKLFSTDPSFNLSEVTSDTVAFSLVPKLNAAGRLESPETAIKILISDDETEIDNIAEKLTLLNSERQKLCEETFVEASFAYSKDINNNKKSIIIFNPDWHVGIIGIVCSKLTETYNKPAFLMTRDTSFPNIIRCSCRSIPGINIHEILSFHKELFEGFGGHKMAAGFSFDENKISFDSVKSLINKTIEEYCIDFDFTKTYVYADMEINPSEINDEITEIISKLEPFGAGNPVPSFIINNADVRSFKTMGQSNNHLKIMISKDDSQILECVKWNTPGISIPEASKIDILFNLKSNTFNNVTKPQLVLSDFHSDAVKAALNVNSVKILDHRMKRDIYTQVYDFLITVKNKTGIFVKNPELLKKFKTDNKNVEFFDSDNIPSDIKQLMFFDVPMSHEEFCKIIKESTPEIIHLMNFSAPVPDIDSFLNKVSGMLKYSLKNSEGKADLRRMANAAGVSVDAVESAIDLFYDEEITDCEKNSDSFVRLSYINSTELSKLKQNALTDATEDILNSIKEYRNVWLNIDTEKIKESVMLIL